MKNGCVCEPDKTDDDVLCVASMDDLFAHKLKVIHDRAEAKDYQDIAVMLASGQSLSRGLAALETLFGSSVPPMVTLKSLAYFNDLNEPWRLTDDMKATITRAISSLPNTWEKIAVFSHTLYCPQSKLPNCRRTPASQVMERSHTPLSVYSSPTPGCLPYSSSAKIGLPLLRDSFQLRSKSADAPTLRSPDRFICGLLFSRFSKPNPGVTAVSRLNSIAGILQRRATRLGPPRVIGRHASPPVSPFPAKRLFIRAFLI